MKRTIAFALTIPLLLTGCAARRQDENEWKAWQGDLARAEEITFTAGIVSRGGTEEVSFTAEVRRGEGRTALTVTAPETIRGVTAVTEGASPRLEYDGLILELCPLDDDAIPPCAAGDLLIRGVSEGWLLWTGRSGERRTAAFQGPGGETVTLWREEDGAPVCAEIARGENPELTVYISNWQIKE
ncbi:MAG: hypothetical protein IJH47_01555 [Oscillospiraceae bacterium]|nr:hypothetical protein [Oscillospiraceae bacterium]